MSVTGLIDHSGDPDFTPDQSSIEAISGFGEDAAGNLYIVKLGTPSGSSVVPNSGEIFVVPEPSRGAAACLALVTVALLRKWRAATPLRA